MAKVKAPLMSLQASGKLGKGICYGNARGVHWVRRVVKPHDSLTILKLFIRTIFQRLPAFWKYWVDLEGIPLNPDIKQAYIEAAKGKPKTGYNLFLSDFYAKNWPITDYENFNLVFPQFPGDRTHA